MWLVVTGTINEGFSIYVSHDGKPFRTPAEADAWAQQQSFSPNYVLTKAFRGREV